MVASGIILIKPLNCLFGSRIPLVLVISYVRLAVLMCVIEPCDAQGRTPGEPFIPKPTKEAEMEKMLRSVEVTITFWFRFCLSDDGCYPVFVQLLLL